jgi:hypothetical protein
MKELQFQNTSQVGLSSSPGVLKLWAVLYGPFPILNGIYDLQICMQYRSKTASAENIVGNLKFLSNQFVD